MGKLRNEEVEHVAKLAKLKLTPGEVKKFQKQLSEVLTYMEELDEVEIKDTEPVAQTTGLVNILRKDEIETELCLSQDEALSGTEKVKGGYFEVEAVIDKSG